MGLATSPLVRFAEARQMTGICLAIVGNLLISIALNLTKHAHNINQSSADPRPYVALPLWWIGFFATIIGELGNFAAYGFAPASLIAPLGAVSVLSNAFIAALVLGEGLRARDLVGCALCIGGGVIIVLSSSSHPADPDIDTFLRLVQDHVFIGYIACLSLATAFMLGFQDQYGSAHVSYYVLLCSMLGSVTVLACKGVSTMINMWACCRGPVPMGQPVFFMLLLVLVVTAVLQIRYLNVAMENFGNTETVPVFYVLFTLCTILSSNFLFHDFEQMSYASIAAFCSGCSLTFIGVILLTSERGDRSHAPSRRESPSRRGGGAATVRPAYEPSAMATPDTKRASLIENEASATREASRLGPGRGASTAAELWQRAGAGVNARLASGRRGLRPGHMPLALMNTPLGLGGDTLRRTFSLSRSEIVTSPGGSVRASIHRDRQPLPYV
mmetsp:Transcript_29396/g.90090  ORF Transcript_29396/g.90090 Transcript_29396/m.90090 type:complete len:443 (-) Transcript_29396:411-1739(-)